MTDVINLRQARKTKQRMEKEKNAAANRAKFGRSKGERTRDETRSARIERMLDRAKIDPTPD